MKTFILKDYENLNEKQCKVYYYLKLKYFWILFVKLYIFYKI